MKSSYLVFVAVLVFASYLCSQPPGLLWQRTLGGSENDHGWDIQKTHSGDYIVVATTNSFGAGDYDVYLVKVNVYGDTLWTRTFGSTGNDRGYNVVEASDWGYAISGSSGGNAYLVRIDIDGNPMWERSYTTGVARDVQQATDGGFVFTGGDNGGVYLIKTDTTGNQRWMKTYGGRTGHCVRQTDDGGYIVVGTAGFETAEDVYVIRTNAVGDSLWTRRFGGEGEDIVYSMDATSDGGYILGGTSNSFSAPPPQWGWRQLYLIKIDDEGDTTWTRTYGEGGFDYEHYGNSVIQTSDGGYFVAGAVSGWVFPRYNAEILKTDPMANVEYWWHGGLGPMSGFSGVTEIDSGNYMLVGGSCMDIYIGLYDIWLVAIGRGVSVIEHDSPTPFTYRLLPPYPNPFNAVVTVGFEMPVMGEVGIRVYDVLGRKVGTLADGVMIQGTHSARWDAGGMPSGIYFVQMEAGDYREVKKAVLLK